MTVQPTRDQLRALASRAADDGYTGNDNDGHLTVSPAVLVALLDQLDQAEARIGDVLDEQEAHVPSDEDMRDDHVQDRANPDTGRRTWDAWIAAHDARVRRDAARSGYHHGYNDRRLERDYNHAYPEETP